MSSAVLSNKLRQNFLDFFKKKGHEVIPSSSLVPKNDPSVLFTTAGMQQFKRFYLFPDEAPTMRIATCQKCVRTGDIDEVGDETHLTFFEMLGNFSFGYKARTDPSTSLGAGAENVGVSQREVGVSQCSYFKDEAIKWAWEFLTEVLKIDKSRIYATYFCDEKSGVPEDIESLKILNSIEGLEKIEPQGFDDNFWSLGTEGSPGGPTVEFYVDNVEVWNLVFNEFVLKNGKYEPAELKGVDTGMGLERLTAVMQGESDVYKTDAFAPIISKIEELSGKEYSCHPEHSEGSNEISRQARGDTCRAFRIIADHLKAAIFLIKDGVQPSNKEQGYILRRLLRRSAVKMRQLKDKFETNLQELGQLIGCIIQIYRNIYFTDTDLKTISPVIEDELIRFSKTLERGLKEIQNIRKIDGKIAFDFYQSYGFPLELTEELFKQKGQTIDKKQFSAEFEKHKNLSRTASAGKFKGGLADQSEQTIKYHTATHLLHQALFDVLGNEVRQEGSNITSERLRFDFYSPQKPQPPQIKKAEEIVNQKIKQSLPVEFKIIPKDEAFKIGAKSFFREKYPDMVKVYFIGKYSKEFCGGPHVKNTSEIGKIEIYKFEKIGSNLYRIYAK